MILKVVKASAHGLGFLHPPNREFDNSADAPLWIVEAWEWISRIQAGLSADKPAWFDYPAMMRFTITTREVLKVMQSRQKDFAYRERTKPFNFIISPILDELCGYPIGADPNKFMLVAPYTSDAQRWYDLQYFNVHDGKEYRLGRPGDRLSYEAEPKTYGDIVRQYPWHPEAKSLAPDGSRCTPKTRGLLQRTPVTADGFRYIGKEKDRRWEKGQDISVLTPNLSEYRPNETARLTTDFVLQVDARQVSIRALADAAGVSAKTVKSARKGDRLRKTTVEKLRVALLQL